MEGSPSPIIVGYPHPFIIFCIDPMSVGAVGLKIIAGIGHPHIAVIGVFHPLAVRTQFVIKGLIGNFTILVVILGRERISE